MTALVDTSVLVRYLTDDPPGSARDAAVILDGEEDLLLPEVVVTETGYVLESRYRVPRNEVVEGITRLLLKANVAPLVLDRSLAIQALMLCAPSRRTSFTDALTWAAAHDSGVRDVYTLDAKFPDQGLTLRRLRP